jgi:hypothetical protein
VRAPPELSTFISPSDGDVGVDASEGVVEFGGGGSVDGEPSELESGVEPAVDSVAGDDVVDDEVSADVVDPESAGLANAVAGEVATAIRRPAQTPTGQPGR